MLGLVFVALAVVNSAPVALANISSTALGTSTAPRGHATVFLGQSSLSTLFVQALKATQAKSTSTAEGKLREAEEAEEPTETGHISPSTAEDKLLQDVAEPTGSGKTGHQAPSAGATLAGTILNAVHSEDLSALTGEGRRS
jgi:hypothetical protein